VNDIARKLGAALKAKGPPPIRQLERRMKGGFGVMFDDLLAAGYTLLVLALAKRLLLP